MYIGRYEVIRELKGGGMGSVTLCRAPDGALVVLKRPYATDSEAAVRLRDEARLGSRLLHPGLVDTLDLFEHEGRPVLVVAYVDGLSLEVLRRIGPLPVPVVARIGRQIADALDAIHNAEDERGRPMHILHRDVTPGNILLGKDGNAKLIDLGIARFSERQAERTQDGFLRGTMRYLAPELLEGGNYSAASDLWALGMVMWEAMLGRFAYRGETDREVLAGIILGRPMKLDDSERPDAALHAAIEPLLQRLPVERTREAAEAAARFSQIEDRFDDTRTLAQEALDDAIARKEPSMELPVLGQGGGLEDGPAVGAPGFEDVVTHAEADEYAGESADEDPTVPLKTQRPGRAPDVELEATEPGVVDDLAPQATVAVPAPVDFDPASALGRDTADFPPSALDLDSAEQTAVDFRSPDEVSDEAPAETARRVAAVRDALLALSVSEEGEPFPPIEDDDDEPTLSSSAPPPSAAFPSDYADRAAGFDDDTPAAIVAPAPQLDDDDLEHMHTLDGLKPVQDDGPGEIRLRSRGQRGRPRSRDQRSPSWDAVDAVRAGGRDKSHVHVRVDADDEATDKAIGRVNVVKKRIARPVAAGAEDAKASRASVDIDALPPARPVRREESPEDLEDALSPFSGPTEVAPPPSPSLLHRSKPGLDQHLPDLEVRDPTEAETGPQRRLRPKPDEDYEPTEVDVQAPSPGDTPDGPAPGDSPGELRMDTSVGAKIEEMPLPASPVGPVEPLGPYVDTEAFLPAGGPDDDEETETATQAKKGPAFSGRGTVSLGEVASLLDDD